MRCLRNMIDELSERADDSDLIALLATCQQTRLYNAHLARELRDVVRTIRMEFDCHRAPALCQSNEIRTCRCEARVREHAR